MQVQFFKGNIANLPTVGEPHSFYVVEDTKQIFRANADGLIQLYSDIEVLATLPITGAKGKLYVHNGRLYIYDNGWVTLGGGGVSGVSEWATNTPYTADILLTSKSALYKVLVAHTSTTIIADVMAKKIQPIVATNNSTTNVFYDDEDNIVRLETTGGNPSTTVFEYANGNITKQIETTPLYIITTVITYEGDNVKTIDTSEERRV